VIKPYYSFIIFSVSISIVVWAFIFQDSTFGLGFKPSAATSSFYTQFTGLIKTIRSSTSSTITTIAHPSRDISSGNMFPIIDENPELASPEDRENEQLVFQKTVRAFRNYKPHTLSSLAKRRRDWNSIDPKYQELVPEYELRLGYVEHRVGRNAEFLGKMVEGQGFEEMEVKVGGGKGVSAFFRAGIDTLEASGRMLC
jgi:hypothetical protein